MNHTANDTPIWHEVRTIAQQAKEASVALRVADSAVKNAALEAAANALLAQSAAILSANQKDVELAKQNGVSGAFLDRLMLDESRINAMAKGLRDIAALPDPVGNELARWQRPNGLDIARVAVPLGVIGIIYESRPNVTADAGGLCLKSGNAAILRGGSESFHSSAAIMRALQEGLTQAGLPANCVQLLPTKDRAAVGAMLHMHDCIDVIIPRGGKSLIQRVIEESTIPTLQHLDGNCHSYIHEAANQAAAIAVVVNAKMRRTGICGATESIVIDQAIANAVLPTLADALTAKNCVLRGCRQAQAIDSRIEAASAEDWDTEYLDALVSIKIVANIDEALSFIQAHSSAHTDAILTEDSQAAARFFNTIDSAIVMQNASTQFADGGEFGMGAEIGIATGKLHARGPVGVEQLCTFKYVVRGNGHTRH